MPLAIRNLLELDGLGLNLVAGERGLDRPIRWVHTSELQDPTPWLRGGELILTTGMGLRGSPSLQRAYIRRLVGADLAGLGFGLGFGFDEVPPPIVRAADREGFPVLEVPYPVPFIAISEAVSTHLADERVRDAQLSVEVHERLASLVADGAGPADVLDESVSLTGGWSVLFDVRGNAIAAADGAVSAPDPALVWRSLPPRLREREGPTSSTDVGPQGTQVAVAVSAGKEREGILVLGKRSRLDQRDRIVVHHAVTVLGLLLSSRRAVAAAERRVAGDVLAEALAGRVAGSDLERRLELVGFSPGGPVTAIVVEADGVRDAAALEDLAWSIDGALGLRARGVRTAVLSGRIASLVSADDAEALAASLLDDLDAAAADLSLEPRALRVGLGRPSETKAARDSYLSAIFALRAAPADRRIAGPRDLGTFSLLLGTQSAAVLEAYVTAVIGPLVERDRDRHSTLAASVKAFIEAGGRWEPGAEALGVHRHTLRYRVRQAEELLGRDLSRAEDRLEVWLALKAAEVLAE
ncbi:MAG TPA: PucR family transcriptional regulator ligand-binding domain-containing protein [Actinomycetota bacterium]|nr:PucR family transcriptional regulator ligand-binding domain-containing protein [Actinomycetota bacterium]